MVPFICHCNVISTAAGDGEVVLEASTSTTFIFTLMDNKPPSPGVEPLPYNCGIALFHLSHLCSIHSVYMRRKPNDVFSSHALHSSPIYVVGSIYFDCYGEGEG